MKFTLHTARNLAITRTIIWVMELNKFTLGGHSQSPLVSESPLIHAVVKVTDMTEEMQHMVVNTALDAMQSYWKPWDIAAFIKKKFDTMYYPSWMCVVGKSFGR